MKLFLSFVIFSWQFVIFNFISYFLFSLVWVVFLSLSLSAGFDKLTCRLHQSTSVKEKEKQRETQNAEELKYLLFLPSFLSKTSEQPKVLIEKKMSILKIKCCLDCKLEMQTLECDCLFCIFISNKVSPVTSDCRCPVHSIKNSVQFINQKYYPTDQVAIDTAQWRIETVEMS